MQVQLLEPTPRASSSNFSLGLTCCLVFFFSFFSAPAPWTSGHQIHKSMICNTHGKKKSWKWIRSAMYWQHTLTCAALSASTVLIDWTVTSHTQQQHYWNVSWRGHWQVATLILLFSSLHLFIHTPAKPSDEDSWTFLSPSPVSSTFCISTYACCPCRTHSPGYREGVWISVWE